MNKYIILSLLIVFPFLAQPGNFKITHGTVFTTRFGK